MILQPGIALILCDLAERIGRPSALRYIELTGEYLETAVQRKIQQIFFCQTANQYGTKEVNSIAFECPEGRMHIMSDSVYLEIVSKEMDDREKTGNICVTTLCNFAMPFVRFRLEDRGRIKYNVSCACGRCGDILELLVGRDKDSIVGTAVKNPGVCHMADAFFDFLFG